MDRYNYILDAELNVCPMCEECIDKLSGSMIFLRCKYSFSGKIKNKDNKGYVDIKNTRNNYTSKKGYLEYNPKETGVASYTQLVI